MKKIFSLVTLLINVVGFSQAPTIQWQKCLGGTNEEVPYDVKQTKDGGYIVVGSSKSNDVDVSGNHSSGIVYEDYWVAKIDSLGNLKWQRSLGGTVKDVANSVWQCTDGGYVVAGFITSNDGDITNYKGGVSDEWIVRLDTAGNIKWQKTFGGAGEDGAEEIQQTFDGGFVFVGWSSSTTLSNHDYDYHIVKLDTGGVLQWEKFYGGTGDDTPYSIQQTSDSGYVASGYSQSNDGDVTGHHGALANNDCWVIKLDIGGNLKWQRSYGGTGQEEATCVRQTKEGGYVFAGWTTASNGDVSGTFGSFDYWVVKLDTAANITWQKCFGGTSVEQAYSIQQTSDSGYVVCGNVYSTNGQVVGNHGGPTDFWTIKLDTAGNLKWQDCLGGTNWDVASSIQQTKDGGYVLAGSTASVDGDITGYKGGNFDYWVLKLKDFTTGVKEVKDGFSLFPNPVTERLFVEFPENSSNTKITLFNAYGQKIMSQFADQKLNTISLQNLPEGMYFVEISTNNKISTTKIVKINP